MTFDPGNEKSKPPRSRVQPSLVGRVVIEGVAPEIDGGASAAKRIEGEPIFINADVYSDGHDVIACDLLWRYDGQTQWSRKEMRSAGNDTWSAEIPPRCQGKVEYTIEAWRDPFSTLVNDIKKKLSTGQNIKLELLEIQHILETNQNDHSLRLLNLIQIGSNLSDQLALLTSSDNMGMMRSWGPRESIARYKTLLISIDRKRAAFSAWYEMFPRSAANDARRHGHFRHVIGHLDYVKSLGFDVLYFPPIHPVGGKNRKGPNNSLIAGPNDPGSVYAIGSEAGGHDSIHPQLGTLEDFHDLVEEAAKRGLELALDFAIQCSPDHPWIKEHPDWFDWRPDGSVRFAENPPKKYEDIVSVKFDGPALPQAWWAWRDVILFWVRNGVRIFRVDNPHTKPLPFWRWLIESVNADHPDVIFLAEAFTRPKMMQQLAKIGFQQSYTYFTWRNTKQELIDYVNELNGAMAEYYRPNFFVNTPDINPYYLQNSGRAGFIVRATLAATLSPNWGIYSGFELCEAAALPGREEYLNSEKYELRARNFDASDSISGHIRKLNQIRNSCPELQVLSNTVFLNAWNDNVLAYARIGQDRSFITIVITNLDPNRSHECVYEAPLWEFGLSDFSTIEVEDLLSGGFFYLHGKTHQITLDPAQNPVIIWRLINPALKTRQAP